MTTVVLVVRQPEVCALAAGRLLPMLVKYGVTDVTVLGRREVAEEMVAVLTEHIPAEASIVSPGGEPGSDLAALAGCVSLHGAGERIGRIVVIDCSLVVSDSVLGDLLADPRLGSAAVVHDDSANKLHARELDARVEAHVVASAASVAHEVSHPNAALAGLLLIAEPDREAVSVALLELSALAATHRWQPDLLRLTSLAMVRRGAAVAAVSVGEFVLESASDPDRVGALAAQADSLDEARLRRRAAATTGPRWTRHSVLRIGSMPITGWAIGHRVRPAHLTLASLVAGLGGAYALSFGSMVGTVAGVFLVVLAALLAGADGELARYTRSASTGGRWLNDTCGYLCALALVGGVAAGVPADLATPQRAWTIAALVVVAGVVLSSGRAGLDLVRAAQRNVSGPPTLALELRLDTAPDDGGPGVSESAPPPVRRFGTSPLDQLADVGVLGRIVTAQLRAPSVGGRFGWALPGLMHWLGLSAVVAAVATWGGSPGAANGDVLVAMFVFVAVVALHHLDVAARLVRFARGLSPWTQLLTLGWDGRLVVVLAIVLLVPDGQVARALLLMAGVLAALFATDCWRQRGGPATA